jgi:hypothetical protein
MGQGPWVAAINVQKQHTSTHRKFDFLHKLIFFLNCRQFEENSMKKINTVPPLKINHCCHLHKYPKSLFFFSSFKLMWDLLLYIHFHLDF